METYKYEIGDKLVSLLESERAHWESDKGQEELKTSMDWYYTSTSNTSRN